MWCLLNKNVYFCSMLQFENQKIKQIVRKVLPVVTLGVMLYSCASIGRPDGGPEDMTPPRFIGSTPEAGALNNKRTKVSLMFDEFIKLEKATEKVVVSPPQIQQPEMMRQTGAKTTVFIWRNGNTWKSMILRYGVFMTICISVRKRIIFMRG